MDNAATFADAADAFARWLRFGNDRDSAAVRECLRHLVELYRAGMALHPESLDDTGEFADIERVDEAERREVLIASRRLPVDLYNDVYNPVATPHEDAITGSVSDDLADIYRDVVSGLRAYRGGDQAGAVWEWSLGLYSHWGAHATSAIRVLHWWLSDAASSPLPQSDDRAI